MLRERFCRSLRNIRSNLAPTGQARYWVPLLLLPSASPALLEVGITLRAVPFQFLAVNAQSDGASITSLPGHRLAGLQPQFSASPKEEPKYGPKGLGTLG